MAAINCLHVIAHSLARGELEGKLEWKFTDVLEA